MHISPGVVEGGKLMLSYASATAALAATLWYSRQAVTSSGLFNLIGRSLITTLLVLMFFEVFWHQPVGVSEVHLILGSTLFLLFGPAATAIGLAAGLLLQGLLFAPFDLPQYGMNVTTLLLPLFALSALARRIIPAGTAYVDLGYGQVFKLSVAYQGGIILWVGFWACYGQGVGAENLANIASFAAAYATVILIEPLVDLAVLAMAKTARGLRASAGHGLFEARLYAAA